MPFAAAPSPTTWWQHLYALRSGLIADLVLVGIAIIFVVLLVRRSGRKTDRPGHLPPPFRQS